MNRREKILTAAVGLLFVVGALLYAAESLGAAFAQRQARVAALSSQVDQQELAILRGQHAARDLEQLKQRSLPSQSTIADSRYRDWLWGLIGQVELTQPSVNQTGRGGPRQDLYHLLTYKIDGRANLDQVVQLLHQFYSRDHLHRIKSLTLTPVTDSQLLTVILEVEALALTSAPSDRQELTDRVSQRLIHGSLDAYRDTIVRRNFFAPGNNPPTISTPSPPPVYAGRTTSFNIPARDPDPNQTLTYELLSADNDAVELNAATGEVTITPQETGRIEFVVQVTDSGLPPMSANRTIRVDVRDPPAEPAPPPGLDLTRLAVLSAITESGGERRAWIHLRTENRMLKVSQGESLTIGDKKGVVLRVGIRDVEIEIDGRRLRVVLGETLADGRQLPLGE